MLTEEQIDELMLKVRQADRYTWSMIDTKRNIYGLQELTKEEWEAWIIRHPRGALTSKEHMGTVPIISNKYIGIKRELGAKKKP